MSSATVPNPEMSAVANTKNVLNHGLNTDRTMTASMLNLKVK